MRRRFEDLPGTWAGRWAAWAGIGCLAVFVGWICQERVSTGEFEEEDGVTATKSYPPANSPAAEFRAAPYHRHWDFNSGPPDDLELYRGAWTWESAAGVNSSGALSGKAAFYLPSDCPDRFVIRALIRANRDEIRNSFLTCRWMNGPSALPMTVHTFGLTFLDRREFSAIKWYVDRPRWRIGSESTPLILREIPGELVCGQPDRWRLAMFSQGCVVDELSIAESGMEKEPDWDAFKARKKIEDWGNNFDTVDPLVFVDVEGAGRIVEGKGPDDSRAMEFQPSASEPVNVTLSKRSLVVNFPVKVTGQRIQFAYYPLEDAACGPRFLRPLGLLKSSIWPSSKFDKSRSLFDFQLNLISAASPLKRDHWHKVTIIPESGWIIILIDGKFFSFWKNRAQNPPRKFHRIKLRVEGACRIDNLVWGNFTEDDKAFLASLRSQGFNLDMSLSSQSGKNFLENLRRMGIYHRLDPLWSGRGDF